MILMIAAVCLVGWLGLGVFWDLKPYLLCHQRSAATLLSGSIVKQREDQFAILATYQFFVSGKEVIAQGILPAPYHLNEGSAQKALKKILGNRNPSIFYNPNNVYETVWERVFPWKKIAYFILTVVVIGYLSVMFSRTFNTQV